jgi:ribosomal protein S18 acetylase RimI-like enzyme
MSITSGYKKIPVHTWYLAFAGNLSEIPPADESINIERWENPPVKEYLEIYKEIGQPYGWTGRLLKTTEELAEILHSETTEAWLFQVNGKVAGFFEFVRSELETEIVYLGLKPEWIGKGLGQKLIRAAISKAGQNGEKVWLHTCERDHASALQAYLKAGFRIEKEIRSLEYYPE